MRITVLKALGIVLILSGCATHLEPSETLKTLAQQYEGMEWNVRTNRPKYIKGEGGVVLKPCDASDPEHQALFIRLYTEVDSVKGYLDGKPKTKDEALNLLDKHSQRWDDGMLLSGFVGYTSDNRPFMHGGIGIFPSRYMVELFLIELPEFRNKGLGKKAMVALDQWAVFLNKVGNLTYGNVQKSEVRTIIARVSRDNTPAIKLLIDSGFKSFFNEDEFKDELNEPRPHHVKLTQDTVIVDGVSHQATIMTTPRRPDPKIIFLKRISGNK
jgi:GNAT superfamily N-acetyltransferase